MSAFQRSSFQNNSYQGDGVVVPAQPVVTRDFGAGSGKWYKDETELWEYIAALKASFQKDEEEQKEALAESLNEAQIEKQEFTAQVPVHLEPLDGLYADLDDIMASTDRLETKWRKARAIEAEYRAMQQEEQEIASLLVKFALDDAW